MWEVINLGNETNINEYLDIINDALCYGFEFKIENHQVWFRELTN